MAKLKPVVTFMVLMLFPLMTGAAEETLSPGMAVFRNIFPGFGLGSLAQRDHPAAALLLTSEVGATVLLVVGLVSQYVSSSPSGSIGTSDYMIIVAFFIYGGAKILGILFPLLHEAFVKPSPVAADAIEETASIFVRPGLTLGAGTP